MATLQIFDVEHGACALLTAYGGGPLSWPQRMMIDCGHNATTGWRPGDYLRSQGIGMLDILTITNYDEDHVSGFPSLQAQAIDVRWIVRNTSVSPQTIRDLKTEDGMGAGIAALVNALGGYKAPAESAPAPEFPGVQWSGYRNLYPTFDDENNLSLVLHLVIDGYHFLFPGDLECAGWRRLLADSAEFCSILPKIHVLVASHHGRESGICPDIFDDYGCRPRCVVISDDYRQYATQETVNYYASKCVGFEGFRGQGTRYVLTTRHDGDITFTTSPGSCLVS